jgi:hypothetical protein
MRFPRFVPFVICLTLSTFSLFAQSPNGNINGQVADPSSAAVVGAEIVAVNDVTGVQYTTKSNSEGIYVLPNLPPGPYRVQVSKIGFKTLIKPDVTLNVQDSLSINFTLLVGAFHEIVTVQGGAPLVNTENATVSTVVDRQFAENIPMNGRSFQTLIELTPGVTPTVSTGYDSGQFSVNGQRADSNYWMVDGVSANIGITQTGAGGNGLGGSLGSFSVVGGTNSLVSVDALQEFRIQTSSFAPEFGRTPGGQISIVTRSGANQFHGSVFDYLRNDVLDANNWYNGYNTSTPLPKAKERQNDFGGTFSGPLVKDRTFFFFSYEGLRLRLPQTTLTSVPDAVARQQATAPLQPYLNAFPQSNGTYLGNGIGEFSASYSNPATLDAYSLRIDHKLNEKWSLFGRYANSPSQLAERGGGGSFALSVVELFKVTTQTATFGATRGTPTFANDFRFNYSRTNAASYSYLDNFGGAVPLTAVPFPEPFTTSNSSFGFGIFALTGSSLDVGKNVTNTQRQINAVDNIIVQKGSHSLKFGIDFRRLSPQYAPFEYEQGAYFNDVQDAQTGSVDYGFIEANRGATFLFRNLGVFAQDTWRASPRLTLTYGLRWDIDFVPQSLNGPSFPAVTGFNLNDISNLALAPVGTAAFRTTYHNVAPRVGIAYQIRNREKWQAVLRGGFGVFYDLASQEVGNNLADFYPFGTTGYVTGGFPYDSVTASPPAITPAAGFGAFDPNLKLPYTFEWNAAIEQSVGDQQSFSVSYVGASGQRLLQTAAVSSPNPNVAFALLVANAGSSSYNALQLQFRRRLSRGLQFLTSYTWSHSIDDGSAGSIGTVSNALVPSGFAGSNRGPSDFDIRHGFSAGLTYEFPTPTTNQVGRALLGGWATENFIFARSAPPVTVNGYLYDGQFVDSIGGYFVYLRPDVVSGQAFYLTGTQYPGGKAFNPAAFEAPPIDPATGTFLQGDLGRNALRGFGAFQWDFAIHRDFPLPHSTKLQFRAEMFNLLNHPNFGQPIGNLNDPNFGISTQMLGQSLGGSNVSGGGLSPLYQLGGPRSIQLALKFFF